MNALAKPPVRMTVDEFLDWEPQDGRKWQLVDGEPQAMAPASPTHAFLQNELGALLRNHLLEQGSPCRAATEPGIVPRVLASNNLRVPDLAVTCTAGDGDDGRTLSDPVLVIEILSPSNQPETWYNVWAYTSIPTVQEILVLHSTSIGADLLRRDADGTWPSVPAAVTSGDLVLDSIGFRASLASIYRTTRLRAGG
jgi:Uma2 family endonuclease